MTQHVRKLEDPQEVPETWRQREYAQQGQIQEIDKEGASAARRREPLGGSKGMLPRKSFKSRPPKTAISQHF